LRDRERGLEIIKKGRERERNRKRERERERYLWGG
jgi:hypothetical protein